jgi:hypothetical protein
MRYPDAPDDREHAGGSCFVELAAQIADMAVHGTFQSIAPRQARIENSLQLKAREGARAMCARSLNSVRVSFSVEECSPQLNPEVGRARQLARPG